MISLAGDKATLAGPVTLANVNTVLDEGARLFKASALTVGAVVTVDLGGVTEVDSTAVSLLLEWRRAAQRDKRVIEYVNYPANLKSLIQLYGVAELLDTR